MSYRLKPARPAADELRRVVRKQLDLAATELTLAGRRPDPQSVHEARRHIKKARAALRLVSATRKVAKRSRKLRRAARLLAPIADAEAVQRAFDELCRTGAAAVAPSAADAIRRHLTDALAVVDRRAADGQTLERVGRRLQKERRRANRLSLDGDEFALVAPGFERTVRRSGCAMKRALANPTASHYHAWRRRAKDHWLQVRLLDARCQGRLAREAERLAQLDVALGACHDLGMLAARLEEGLTLARPDLAAVLRLIRREQQRRRHEAAALGAVIYGETPREATERAGRAWRGPSASGVSPLAVEDESSRDTLLNSSGPVPHTPAWERREKRTILVEKRRKAVARRATSIDERALISTGTSTDAASAEDRARYRGMTSELRRR